MELKAGRIGNVLMSIYFLPFLQAEWYWYALVLFGPDISLIAYLINKKVGAVCYNFFHHKTVAIALLFICYFLPADCFLLIAVVIFGHSSQNRFFGFGLKYYEGFNITHLGKIRKDS